MGYLLLTILGGAMVSVLMRLSESKIKNSIGMLEANYFLVVGHVYKGNSRSLLDLFQLVLHILTQLQIQGA